MPGDPQAPHDINAERATLGAMLTSPAAAEDVQDALRGSSDFYRPAHQAIYEAICQVMNRGERADPITVKAELEHRGALARCGGADYLHTLQAAVPVAASGSYYAAIVRDHAARRDLDEAGQRIIQAARQADADPADRADTAHRVLDEATAEAIPPGAQPISAGLPALIDALQQGPAAVAQVRTGWEDLEVLVPGFRGGELTVIGARPSMGKSAVMLSIAATVAASGFPVLVQSLEMTRSDCHQRLLAAAARVPLTDIISGELSTGQWARIDQAVPDLNVTPLNIDDNPHVTLHSIRANVRAMRRRGDAPSLIVVDYLQLMTTGARPENRQQEIAALARGLKLLAKELGIPVLAGSQLNRGAEQRVDKRPLLADLRESGAVEQDSDVVILLYRDDYYDHDSPHPGEIDLIVAKNRNGRCGTATLRFTGPYTQVGPLGPRRLQAAQ